MLEQLFEFLIAHPLAVGTLVALLIVFFWNENRLAGSTISPAQLVQLVNKSDATIVDLRTNAEFRQGHIVGAINIPYTSIGNRMDELEAHKQNRLVLVCKLGQHSGGAGRKLRSAGFKVQRLSGGISEWTASSMPLVRS